MLQKIIPLPLYNKIVFMRKKIIISSVLLIIGISIIIGYHIYRMILAPNVICTEPIYLYITSEDAYTDVCKQLQENKILLNFNSFDKVAQRKNYPNKVKAGRYKITPNISNNELINMLRSGRQEPINLTFNNIRTKLQFANRIAEQIECNADDILTLLNSDTLAEKYGFTIENILCMFIPNTYQFYWNTSANQFIERMYKEYQIFWNESRTSLSRSMSLSPIEVSILASIVEEENHLNAEQATIAGLFINRLHQDMPLESDPTLKFALGDFNIKRVLNQDKLIDSPYNTYMYRGLPPGPIRIPSPKAIDAVLHYEKHNYIYMCAKEDFSGYHNFAVTLSQHNRNANRYHQALNSLQIKR